MGHDPGYHERKTNYPPKSVPDSLASPSLETDVVDDDDPALDGIDCEAADEGENDEAEEVSDDDIVRDRPVPPPLPSRGDTPPQPNAGAVLLWDEYRGGKALDDPGSDGTTGSSLSTASHLTIDLKLKKATIELPRIGDIPIEVLRNLALMLISRRWITDEGKRKQALIAFLTRVKNGQSVKRLKSLKPAELEALFFSELSGKDRTLAHAILANKADKADKEGKTPPPTQKD